MNDKLISVRAFKSDVMRFLFETGRRNGKMFSMQFMAALAYFNFRLDKAPAVNALILPCKCGDTVYDIFEAFHNGGSEIKEYPVVRVCVEIDQRGYSRLILGNVVIPLDDFGKTAFLSKAEAQAALKGRSSNE